MFENLEKIPVKKFNVSVKVSSVGPATVLKMNSFIPYFSSFLTAIAEELFRKTLSVAVFGKIFTRKTFDPKIQAKY